MSVVTPVLDTRDRPLRDLRISVTDRCNFRCTYCMPKQVFSAHYPFLARTELLSFEEIARLACIFAGLGVTKIRLTGGEPLMRRQLETLIMQLVRVPGIVDISLTTNGALLTQAKAQALKAAGLKRITISLDALDDVTFKAINDVDFPVARVLEAIDHAAGAGLAVKVNMVVKRGLNAHSVLPMARFFHGSAHVLRFIEYMDVGATNGWRLDEVFSAAEMITVINAEMPIEPIEPRYPGEVARRWRYRDGGGEIGLIASVTQPFCNTCTRARLSAEGVLYTCLFAHQGHDLKRALRTGASDTTLMALMRHIWVGRQDRYSEQRAVEYPGHAGCEHPVRVVPRIEMSYIGG